MKEFIRSDKGKILYVFIWIAIGGAFLVFMIPPVFEVLVNRIEPFVFGVPWTVFMHVLLWVIMAIGLGALYSVQNIRNEL